MCDYSGCDFLETLQYVKFTLSFSVSFAQLSELPFFAQFFTTSGAARFLSSDWLIIFFLVELVKFFDWLLVFLLADWLFHITTRSIPEGANNGLVLLFSLTEKYVNIMYGSYGRFRKPGRVLCGDSRETH